MFKSVNVTTILKPALICLVLLLFSFTIYHFNFGRRIIPGVTIGQVYVGGLNYDQAVRKLSQKESETKKVLPLVYQDQRFEIEGESISLEYNHEAAVIRAFEVGRTGNFLIDTKDKAAGLVKRLHIPAFYTFEDEDFSLALSGIKGEINIEAKEAGFSLKEGKLVRVQSNEGLKVDDKDLYDLVLASLNNLDFSEKKISVSHTRPTVTIADLDKVENLVETAVFKPLKLKSESKEWQLTSDQVVNFIKVVNEEDEIKVEVEKSAFDAYVELLSQGVDEMPRGKVTEVRDGKVIGFEMVRGGKKIDRDKFKEVFSDAIFKGGQVLEIPVKDVEQVENISKYGIFALLGEGKSRFSGSASARIHNLSLAAERTNGVLVPPNSIYSLNKAVGDISAATGYNSAYIIQNGRTVLGEGGGVCQTSTTLFRAILNAGLPVVTRYPHAYRVSYYELDSPVGFDAAIFQPSLDLQFKNDTPNYVLVQSEVDTKTSTITFRIYGTPDGRSVEISKPVISNVTPAPEPLYQDDPTLPKGTRKQIDFAASGANVSFTREVTRDGEVLYKDTFSSRYQPWRAVYLVGTKE